MGTFVDELPPDPNRGLAEDDYVEVAQRWAAALPNFGRQIDRIGQLFNLGASLLTGGYGLPEPYRAGLTMQIITQSVQYGTNTYAPIISQMPFLTSGVFEADKFRLIQGVMGADLVAASGGAMVGVVERSTGAPLRLSDAMARMPSRYGRIDAGSFPRLFDAIRRYRYGNPAQSPITVAIFGSSLGNGPTLPNPSTQAPGMDFIARLRAEVDPGGLIQFAIYNYSINGSTVTDWPAAITAMTAAGVVPHLCYLIPGMNDFAVAQWNSGQGADGFQRVLGSVLYDLKNIGSDVVVTTSMHPSVVNYPSLQSMPAGMSQVYPTIIAAPVSDAALQPSATDGLMQIDVLKNGHPITVSKRYYLGNLMIKSICGAFCMPVIDVQQYQFEAYAKQLLELGSMALVESANFDAGQINHPNLTAIGNGYHRANAEACAQLGQQGAQAGHAPRLNGNFGVNLPQNVAVAFGPGLPAATIDIYPRHGDVGTPPLSIKTNTGPIDGYGVKSPVENWRIQPTTGDLESASVVLGGAVGRAGVRSKDHLGRTEVNDRLSYYNVPVSSITSAYILPDNMGGRLTIFATHPGVALSQRYRMEFSIHNGVIAQEPGSPIQIGDNTEFTVSFSGLVMRLTIVNAGTNLHISCQAW